MIHNEKALKEKDIWNSIIFRGGELGYMTYSGKFKGNLEGAIKSLR